MPKPLRVRYSRIQREVDSLLAKHNVTRLPVAIDEIAQGEGAEISYERLEGDLCGFFVSGKTNVVIGVNKWHHPNRQRFTIAHELGHSVLHDIDDVHVDKEFKYRSPISAKVIDIEEIEANTFAAWILIPERMLLSDISNVGIDLQDDERVRELAKKYAVSQQSMSFRVMNLLSRRKAPSEQSMLRRAIIDDRHLKSTGGGR
jgi:Zn-dependent peptidase ImmA (M78 family)